MNEIKNGVLRGNLEVFIIPNCGGLVTNWLAESVQEELKENAKTLCEMNGLEPFDSAKDMLVQLWFTGMDCENMVDHHCHAVDEDGKEYMFRSGIISHLPVKFFKGLKEGDTFNLKYPVTLIRYHAEDDKETTLTVEATVTLNQQGYRYKRFGNFEDVLKQVVY